jgi:hypothetical protein
VTPVLANGRPLDTKRSNENSKMMKNFENSIFWNLKTIHEFFVLSRKCFQEIFPVIFQREKNIFGDITILAETQDYKWNLKAKMFKYNE